VVLSLGRKGTGLFTGYSLIRAMAAWGWAGDGPGVECLI
jgi:hypothetical protein